MFRSSRFMTKGIDEDIPFELQMFIWGCINALPEETDYLQVFELSALSEMQQIIHHAEQPEYRKVYIFPAENPITAKIYVIDSVEYTTMLLAEEY